MKWIWSRMCDAWNWVVDWVREDDELQNAIAAGLAEYVTAIFAPINPILGWFCWYFVVRFVKRVLRSTPRAAATAPI